MDAPTAQGLDLVHQVVGHDELDAAVAAMLDTLLGGSPQAQRATKALLAEVARDPDSKATREHTCRVIAELRVSAEGQEGLASFFEKRRPAWKPDADATQTTAPDKTATERRS
jgi:methylglutaconyl-CoA hydratase